MSRSGRLQLAMCLVWAVAGVLDAALHVASHVRSPVTLVYAVFFAGIIYMWCDVYAEEHGAHPPLGSSILAALLPPVGIPVYFFRLYPFARAAFATLLALVFAAVLMGVYALAVRMTQLAIP